MGTKMRNVTRKTKGLKVLRMIKRSNHLREIGKKSQSKDHGLSEAKRKLTLPELKEK